MFTDYLIPARKDTDQVSIELTVKKSNFSSGARMAILVNQKLVIRRFKDLILDLKILLIEFILMI